MDREDDAIGIFTRGVTVFTKEAIATEEMSLLYRNPLGSSSTVPDFFG